MFPVSEGISYLSVSTYAEQVQVQVVYYFKMRNGRAGTKVKGSLQKIITRAKSRFRTVFKKNCAPR